MLCVSQIAKSGRLEKTIAKVAAVGKNQQRARAAAAASGKNSNHLLTSDIIKILIQKIFTHAWSSQSNFLLNLYHRPLIITNIYQQLIGTPNQLVAMYTVCKKNNYTVNLFDNNSQGITSTQK